jgi:hypothetical protein
MAVSGSANATIAEEADGSFLRLREMHRQPRHIPCATSRWCRVWIDQGGLQIYVRAIPTDAVRRRAAI